MGYYWSDGASESKTGQSAAKKSGATRTPIHESVSFLHILHTLHLAEPQLLRTWEMEQREAKSAALEIVSGRVEDDVALQAAEFCIG
jgi:hypothetical protein